MAIHKFHTHLLLFPISYYCSIVVVFSHFSLRFSFCYTSSTIFVTTPLFFFVLQKSRVAHLRRNTTTVAKRELFFLLPLWSMLYPIQKPSPGMGSVHWFKTIIGSKKAKQGGLKQKKGYSTSSKSSGFKWRNQPQKRSATLANDSAGGNPQVLDMPVEDLAVIQIQTAIRAYLARKALRRLKGVVKMHNLIQNNSVKKQGTTTLNYLHSWSNIQDQIRARRLCMVTEGRLKQKKLENQLKLEAKLHDLEVEWSGGSEPMEVILGRIHQREEAAVRRERTMAYAFSHQWRADSGMNLGLVNSEIGKANWAWSWKERWIAARPWESRMPIHSVSPKKVKNSQGNKGGGKTDSPTKKTPVSTKSSPNGRGKAKPRRLSYPPAGKQAAQNRSIKGDEAKIEKETLVS